MKKSTKGSHHDKKAEPVKVAKPKAGNDLQEAVTPKAQAVGHPDRDCKDCKHAGDVHYGSATNWCNTSGCQCQAYE